jgi:broad specificity phosphatase PhoE
MIGHTRLILVRHAEPATEVRGRVYGRLDVELSEDGVAHAAALAEMLETKSISAIYSSPLRRSIATATPLATRLALELRLDDRLAEIDFGELEGLPVEEVRQRHPELYLWMRAPAGVRFPGGESIAELRARATAAATQIGAEHAGESVAVFSHSVPLRAIVADALGLDDDALFRFDHSYGGISVIERSRGVTLVRTVNAPRL